MSSTGSNIMAGMSSVITLAIFLSILVATLAVEGPLVTLGHGGKVRGLSYEFENKTVHHFLSVRYAEPPTGDLRFNKPVAASWKGEKLAQHTGKTCLQYNRNPNEGEDCLFLDVVVPGGVDQSSERKPVMVWIHGGSYLTGYRQQYIPTPLAVRGDVIVVTINYRLGIFGFLYSGQGTGNYGLWDQRLAINWVKDNIGSFGGDSDRITIFGESAGGSSVAAQMMGRHNDGLFQRAIAESGALYEPWGWYLSEKANAVQLERLKQSVNCTLENIFDCYKSLPGDQVLRSSTSRNDFLYHPMPDDDFFPSDITEEKYDLASRFDLLSGFNGMEGGGSIYSNLDPHLRAKNKSLSDGIDLDSMREVLTNRICRRYLTSQAAELCAEFIIETYGMDGPINDTERVIKYINFAGDWSTATDNVHLLNMHSHGEKASYGFFFSEYIRGAETYPFPEMYRFSAKHGEELPFVFGFAYVTDELLHLYKDFSSNSMIRFTNNSRYAADKHDLEITDTVMTTWSNFAKSGHPLKPVAVQSVSSWTEYRTDRPQVLEFGSKVEMVDLPGYKEKQRMIDVLLPARKRRMEDEKSVDCPLKSQSKERNSSAVHRRSAWIMCLLISTATRLSLPLD